MEIVLKKETKLDIEMIDLMNECISRIEWLKSRKERGRYTPDYENLGDVIRISLEYLYDVDFDFYDNSQEKINVIANNLLFWCLENHYPQEYHDLINFFREEEEEEEEE